MEELQVSQQLGIISTNLDSIAKELKEQMAIYKNYVVTQDSIATDKKVLADLRKTKKSMEDARKSVKSEWEKPYKEFEAKYKTVLELVDEPIELINTQLKLFDEARAAEKLEHVKEIYSEAMEGYEEYLPFENVFNEKWLNATTKDKDIQYDLSEAKTKVISDLSIISGLDSEIGSEILEVYKRNGNDLASAIKRNQQYVQDKARVAEQIKEEVKAEVTKEELSVNETAREEVKPNAEAMGTLNDMVELTKTVHIVISKSDLQAVRNALDFSEIKYQVIE